MLRSMHIQWTRRILAATTMLVAVAIVVLPVQRAFALIQGGEGNEPINDPGWPQGAADIFNNQARIAWWEGPPFGGGQWHAECRGDATKLNAMLEQFAKLDVKTKRLVVHDGVGNSFWLNPNREPEKQKAARMDWLFMVWQPKNWEHLRKMPSDLNPTEARDADKGPPSQIDVYTGGNIRWADVNVPEGIEVIDNRLEAHGYALEDGNVLEGKVIDLATKQPLAARMRLERVEPQQQGGYQYLVAAEAVADADGKWVLKKAPEGWHRVVVEADGYVPRIVGYAQFDDQPRWHSYDGGLATAAPVSGRVTDDEGKPLADVDVRFGDVVSRDDGRYESVRDYVAKTDADGRFQMDQIPGGSATIWVYKTGYCRPGLGEPITTPADDVALRMMKSARVQVTVEFTDANRPEGYIVQIEPEGGEAIGKWGGSGNIDAKNQIAFENVPPGTYVLHGQPNPSSEDQHTMPLVVELKGGETTEVTITAK